MKIDEYRKTLELKIQHDPTLPSQGLNIKFHELIIELFLELTVSNVDVQDKTVIIDGLNECNGNSTQCKIIELVAKLVKEYGNKIPLL